MMSGFVLHSNCPDVNIIFFHQKKIARKDCSFIADSFYDSLRAIADDDRTDGDLSCLLEDVIMELEMLHDEGGSDKKMRELTAEAAERIIEEWF